MSRSALIYTFAFSISKPEQGLSIEIRNKSARHPEETIERLFARVLAYLHAYRDGLSMTNGLYDPDSPALLNKNLYGEIIDWIDLGSPDPKRLERVTRAETEARVQLYFYQHSQIESFKLALKGMKHTFLKRVEFYLIDPELLVQLRDIEERYLEIKATVSDETYYIEINGEFFETKFERLDFTNIS